MDSNARFSAAGGSGQPGARMYGYNYGFDSQNARNDTGVGDGTPVAISGSDGAAGSYRNRNSLIFAGGGAYGDYSSTPNDYATGDHAANDGGGEYGTTASYAHNIRGDGATANYDAVEHGQDFLNGISNAADAGNTTLNSDEGASGGEEDVDAWSPLLPHYKSDAASTMASVSIDGMRPAGKDVFMRFVARTDHPKFPNTTISNERAYKDFELLQKYLVEKYIANLVPPLPALIQASRFSDLFLMRPFAVYLTRLLKHPVLSRDDALLQFMTSNAVFMPSNAMRSIMPIPIPGAIQSLRLKLSGIKDPDDFFGGRMEMTKQSLFVTEEIKKSIHNLAKAHTNFAASCRDLGQRAVEMNRHEEHEFLARRWEVLSQRLRCLADTTLDLAAKENSVATDTLGLLHTRYIQNHQALKYRNQVLAMYTGANKVAERQRQLLERLRKHEDRETSQVQRAIGRMRQVGAEELELYREYRVITELLDRDWDSSENGRQIDVLSFISMWTKLQLDCERRAQQDTWQALRSIYFQ